MDLILICHEADAASVVANALLALKAKNAGRETGVLFSGEALLGLQHGSLLWSRGFWAQGIRWAVADNAKALGIPTRGKGQSREIDVAGILEWARSQDVRFLACPVWTPLLPSHESWPFAIELLTVDQAFALLEETKTVIGGF